MFSNDKNIETIGQLVTAVRHYIGLQTDYAKLDVMTKVVRLLTLATMAAILSLMLAMALIYFSFAAAYALGGIISMRRAYGYSAYTFVYASLVFAIVQYLYFKFLDHGTFFTTLQASATALENAYSQAGVSTDDLKTTLKLMQELSPINWAFIFMMQNILTGVIVGLPIAVMCRRTKRQ